MIVLLILMSAVAVGDDGNSLKLLSSSSGNSNVEGIKLSAGIDAFGV